MSQSVTGVCRLVDPTKTGTTRTRSRAVTRMEDVSFWLAIVLLVSLHSVFDPAQSPTVVPPGSEFDKPQAAVIGQATEWQKLKNLLAEQNRRAV